MPETPNDIENLSPYKLLHNFSKNRVLSCILAAVIIHVAVIGGLSANYIYRTWIDPAANPDEQTAGAPSEDQSSNAKPSGEAPGETPPANVTGGNTAKKDGRAVKDPTKPGDPREDAPVVNRVTEKADPDTIPKQPAGVGISIDDLND